MKIKVLAGLIISSTILFYGCKDEGEQPDDIIVIEESSIGDETHVKQVKMIFYNVPSPLEMANLLEEAGAYYNGDLLNSYKSYERYTTNSKLAANLGIYGADLSYTRMFDQIQSTVNYLASIRKMSDGLGIPEEEGSFTVQRIEENMQNRDSILHIISETYSTADAYLKENGRGGTAALIILGGWIEALYIATNIVGEEEPNEKIIKHIAEQKYSLNNLIELISVYEDEIGIQEYLPMMKDLQSKFEQIEINYTKGQVITDNEKMTTTIDSKVVIDVTPEMIKEIGIIVEDIRAKIIE
jgi:hypothetical protein